MLKWNEVDITDSIWVVSMYKMGNFPIVTVFDNYEAACECYEFFVNEDDSYDRIDIDECPIHKEFLVFE